MRGGFTAEWPDRVVDSGDPLRPGEVAIDLPAHYEIGLFVVGHLRTPWQTLRDCPHDGDRMAGPVCHIDLVPKWAAALTGLAAHEELQVLYWLGAARRDVLVLNPRRRGRPTGAFALRAPLRPNPIGSAIVALLAVDGCRLTVRGLDCVDGTPLLDLKPVVCPMATPPRAAP